VGVNKLAADGEEPYQPLRVRRYPFRDVLRIGVTLGEVCDALRDVWGDCHPSEM
jgi:hypothetical protein